MRLADVRLVTSTLKNYISNNLRFAIGIVQLSFLSFPVIAAVSKFSSRLHFNTVK
jgi:hypothetical protein